MYIQLSPKLNQWITEKVESGFYSSPNEVIQEGLRLLKIQEEQRAAMTEELRHEILIGHQQLDQGKSSSFDESVVKDIKENGRGKRVT